MPSLLHALAAELDVPENGGAQETWGLGYYADDRALLIKKPASILNQRTAYALAPEVKSRILLACAKGTGERSAAPPYRFRRWLFAHTGAMEGLLALRDTVRDKLPDFVRSEVGQASGGALAFGMFLAELHRGAVLEDQLADPARLAQALARTADTIQRLADEAGSGPVRASFVATNGRVVLVHQGGAPLSRKLQAGLERLPAGPLDPALTDFKQLAAALKRFRAVVVAPGDLSERPGWEVIPEGASLVIDAQLNVSDVQA
ncbi:MAG: class II glutamine amidotransferase [Myxococcales bacterium]|nr:class II glutamine amidotransferase [Myxococcales bacterium]MCB9645471.1 class II glutamine amidotransferase [Deltaproteobacteria bacterium]